MGVFGIINGEVAREAKTTAFNPEDSRKNGVKGSHPNVFGLVRVHHFGDALLHFSGRFVGKGECEYLECIRSVGKQVGDAVGQHSGLARAGACNNHNWTLDVFCGLALC